MRMERASTRVEGGTIYPSENSDPNAVAIYATRLSVMELSNISTDANASVTTLDEPPQGRAVDPSEEAAPFGLVHEVLSSG